MNIFKKKSKKPIQEIPDVSSSLFTPEHITEYLFKSKPDLIGKVVKTINPQKDNKFWLNKDIKAIIVMQEKDSVCVGGNVSYGYVSYENLSKYFTFENGEPCGIMTSKKIYGDCK